MFYSIYDEYDVVLSSSVKQRCYNASFQMKQTSNSSQLKQTPSNELQIDEEVLTCENHILI